LPAIGEVVLVHNPLADAQTKINLPHLARVIAKADATTVADAVLAAVDDEAVQVLVAPAQSRLQRRVQIGDGRIAGDE